MYRRILVGVDGSLPSNHAAQAALAIAEKCEGCELIGGHVYAAQMHRTRFEEMEPGLPERYKTEEKLGYLRGVHDGIISGGMKMISVSYLRELKEEAARRRLHYRIETPEGRNYVEMLKLASDTAADLVILGVTGQGKAPEVPMGSVCERVLRGRREGDVLVAHRAWSGRGPIVVGIDGSDGSFLALERAFDLASALQAPIKAVAVYDPYFHGGVFTSISGVLTEEGKQGFNFAAQEQLHDEIIDRGLEMVYRSGLEKAEAMAKEREIDLSSVVLMGRVFSQIFHYADLMGARLVVVGRWGLHHEEGSAIGSNSMNLARISHANVLVVGAPIGERGGDRSEEPVMSEEPGDVEMVRQPQMEGLPPAEVVVLRKTKLLAPEFHRHIVKGRLQGRSVKKGDKIMVYEVEGTVPEGEVLVITSTRVEFK